MTVSLGAAQELFWGVLKISLFFSAESNSINLGAFVNSIAYSQKLKIVVDFCTINLRSPSGMLMARKIWHAFFLQPNVLIHFLSWNQISLQTNWIEPLKYLDFTHISRIEISHVFPHGPMAIVLTFSEVPSPGGSQRHHHLCRDQPGRQLCGLGGVGGTAGGARRNLGGFLGGNLGGFAWFWRDFGDFWLILLFCLMILVILSFCEGFLLDFGWILGSFWILMDP